MRNLPADAPAAPLSTAPPTYPTPQLQPSKMASRIEYSEKYVDDKHEYRHVILPKELARSLPKQRYAT